MPPTNDGMVRIQEQIGDMREQIGQLVGTTTSLRDLVHQRVEQDQAQQALSATQQEKLWSQMRTLTHDRRGRDQVVSGQLELLRKDMQAVEVDFAKLNESFKEMRNELAALKGPVKQFVSMRNQITTAGMVVLAIGSVFWFLAEPIWTNVIQVVWTKLIK